MREKLEHHVQNSEDGELCSVCDRQADEKVNVPCACVVQGLQGTCEDASEDFSGDIQVSYNALSLSTNKLVDYPTSGDYAQLYFSMRGRSTFWLENSPKPFTRFNAQQHNLLFFPDKTVQQEILPEPLVEMLTVYLPLDFLMHHLPDTGASFLQLQEHIIAGTPAWLSETNLPITPRMLTVLYELINCEYAGRYRRMFTEAKVLELLMLQFEQSEQTDLSPVTELKQADIDKMLHARDLILKNIECPCSLIDLAHLVGTNEYYLKKHFKQLFGTTVFGYLNTYRMEQAKKMLLEGNQKVGDIAGALGYKYAAHFTAAFKKHFGYLPQQIKP